MDTSLQNRQRRHDANTIRPFVLASTLLFFSLCINSLIPSAQGVDVNVAVLLPFDDSYLFSYRRVAPAMDLAIEELNRNTRMLRKHRLIVRYADTNCNIAKGINQAIEFYMNRQVHVYFGPVCDFAVAPVARQLTYWNIPMVSPGAMALDFIKYHSLTYPLLTKIGPIHFSYLSEFFVKCFKRFGFNKMKILYTKEGQDYLIKGFSHLVVEALHYIFKDITPDLVQDYFKMSEHMPAMAVQTALADEIGLEYAGRDRGLHAVVVVIKLVIGEADVDLGM
ncbi:atrial natriuretic peptide receptor 3-like [Littorina saxatilis]|uniref:atrial natriuretic peptide receptor 3-like n=1 Tax=Littorina saxatilis TaxID=31220 RepID=UPI0038B6417F